MKESQNDIELIERYLDGELSKDEAMQMGSFANDAAFEALLAAYEVAKDDVLDEALSHQLKSIHAELYPEKSSRKLTYRWIGVAATLVLLAVFGYLGLKTGDTAIPEFETYFEPYPYYDLSRNITEGSFEQAMEYYVSGDFERAWELFNQLEVPGKVVEFGFYRGVCALAVGKPDVAVASLKPLLAMTESIYHPQIKWYLSLAFWQNGDTDEAKKLLSTFTEGDKPHTKARELLEKL